MLYAAILLPLISIFSSLIHKKGYLLSFLMMLVANLICVHIWFNLGLESDLYLWHWFNFKEHSLQLILNLNILSSSTLMTVSTISMLVFAYSIGYFKDSSSKRRYFAKLSFFVFSMYLLILAKDWVTLFISWELVGCASYLLIGFYMQKSKSSYASYQSFIINRISDLSLFSGLVLLYLQTNSSDFSTYNTVISNQLLISGLIFFGVMAKSAQIPMHVWLPNSMAGPSPVSALIHSATMVCAGVYLLVKISFVLHEDIYFYITLVGFIGAISMGLVSIFVDDLKRAIAFSTLSQISIMFLAIGLKLFAFSMAHLHAHAYFKALWFLIAGSIIKATGKTKISEINNMHKDNKILSYSALIATLNLCSIFPTGGFFSKEMLALEIKNIPIWGDYIFYIFLVSAFITCVYSLRLYFSIFLSTGNTKKINKVTYIEKNVIIIFTLLTLIITPFILDLVNKMNNNDTFYDFISVGKNFFIPIVIVVLAAFLIKVFSLRQKMNFSFLVQEIYFQKAYNLFSHILLKKSNLLANLDNKLDLIIKKSSHYFYSNSIKLSNYLQPYVVTNSLMYIAASIFIIILIGALL